MGRMAENVCVLEGDQGQEGSRPPLEVLDGRPAPTAAGVQCAHTVFSSGADSPSCVDAHF